MKKLTIIITSLDKGFIIQIGEIQIAKEKRKDVLSLVEGELYD